MNQDLLRYSLAMPSKNFK